MEGSGEDVQPAVEVLPSIDYVDQQDQEGKQQNIRVIFF
jgi:hypothetical protein